MPFRVFTTEFRAALVLGICFLGALPSDAGSNCETIFWLTEKAGYQEVCFDTVLSIHATGSGQIVFRDDFECGDHTAWSSSAVP